MKVTDCFLSEQYLPIPQIRKKKLVKRYILTNDVSACHQRAELLFLSFAY